MLCNASFREWHRFGIPSRADGTQKSQDDNQVHRTMCRAQKVHKTSYREHGDEAPPESGIGVLFRQWGEEYIKSNKPCLQHIKLIRAIRVCKTPALGGIVLTCKSCGKRHYIYKSCGHSHCMLCQSIKREQWMDRLSAKILQVPYVHTTFTIPHQLNGLFRKNQKVLYTLLMRSCWQTIRSLSEKYDATPGMTGVLHTFGSDMKYHIHVHTLVTYGGLSSKNEWIYPLTKNKLASYRTICREFKNTMIKGIQSLMANGGLDYHLPIEELLNDVNKARWVVHSTRPTMDTKVIQNYLARYINRTAISPSRLTYVKDLHEVHILYNDYAQQKAGQAAPKAIRILCPMEAIGQILQHVLPPYFHKSRNFGLHQSSTKIKALIPPILKNNGATIRTVFEILTHLLGLNPFKCEECGSEELEIATLLQDTKYVINFLQNKAPPIRPITLHADKTSSSSLGDICPK